MERSPKDSELDALQQRAARLEMLVEQPLFDNSCCTDHPQSEQGFESKISSEGPVSAGVLDRIEERPQAMSGPQDLNWSATCLDPDLASPTSPVNPQMLPDRPNAGVLKLSIAMAAHNEQRTVATAITEVLQTQLPCEIELIVIDDGSTDGTLEIIRSFEDPRLTVLVHPSCQGKGASILDAATVATGTHLLVFDADLEYSADEIPSLVAPILDGTASVVYGTRKRGSRSFVHSLIYGLGSKVTTILTNVIFGSRLQDMHTCLKLIPLPLFRQLTLSNSGFGLDTEISCELVRRKIQPFEVPCSYHARSVAQGKQIDYRDGWECLKIIVQVRLRRRTNPCMGPQELSNIYIEASLAD